MPGKYGSLNPLDKTQNSGHAVIVIGSQEIAKYGQKQPFVFFLDPNDASILGQDRTVYRMSHEELAPRLMLTNE
ncbi:hypothetical protein [Legionella waltersii]|uniref:hypothetical protein n=1 Tax=Legionella waltersii TaxID=66969 RepID=UPI00073179C0|nr:hypothetical protein [Legionella waltersii]